MSLWKGPQETNSGEVDMPRESYLQRLEAWSVHFPCWEDPGKVVPRVSQVSWRDCAFWGHGWGRAPPDVLTPSLLTDRRQDHAERSLSLQETFPPADSSSALHGEPNMLTTIEKCLKEFSLLSQSRY